MLIYCEHVTAASMYVSAGWFLLAPLAVLPSGVDWCGHPPTGTVWHVAYAYPSWSHAQGGA